MAKKLNARELMAKRNPLERKPVAPVDIYSAAPEPAVVASKEVEQPKALTVKPTKPKQTKPVPARTEKKSVADDESDAPYSTYLYKRQVKGIKLRAIEDGVNDKEIVQHAVDEYFKNHPL